MYEWDRHCPAIDALRSQGRDQGLPWTALLLEDLGDRQTVTLQVRTDIPLEDTRFTLPRDRRKLRHTLEKLSPNHIVLHHPMTSLHRLAGDLDFPVDNRETETAGNDPCQPHLPLPDQTPFQTVAFTGVQKTGSSWLVPAPRSLAGWHRLCTEARRQGRNGVFFHVMDLDRLWEQTPRPGNIRPCPLDRSTKNPLARAILLLEDDPAHVRAWSEWAAERNIPCYLSSAA